MAQTLRDFLKQVENLPPDTLLCVAEVDEAFAAHVAEIEIIADAKPQNRKAEGVEAVELGNGKERVVVKNLFPFPLLPFPFPLLPKPISLICAGK